MERARSLFGTPLGLATDGEGNLYVADTDNGADARFWHSTGLRVEPSGDLTVTDSSSGKVRRVSPSGRVTTLRDERIPLPGW